MIQAVPFELIPLSLIDGGDSRHDAEQLALLSRSAEMLGLLQPPLVVRANERFVLVGGAGRLAILRAQGETAAWCRVLPFTPGSDEAALAHIDENLARAELKPTERDSLFKRRIEIIQRLRPETSTEAVVRAAGLRGGRGKKKGTDAASDPFPTTATAAAAKLSGVSVREGRRVLRRTKAAPEVLEAYSNGKLRQTQVDELVRLNHQQQIALVPAVMGKTKAETRAIVQQARVLSAAPGGVPVASSPTDAATAIKRVADEARMLTQQIASLMGRLQESANVGSGEQPFIPLALEALRALSRVIVSLFDVTKKESTGNTADRELQEQLASIGNQLGRASTETDVSHRSLSGPQGSDRSHTDGSQGPGGGSDAVSSLRPSLGTKAGCGGALP